LEANVLFKLNKDLLVHVKYQSEELKKFFFQRSNHTNLYLIPTTNVFHLLNEIVWIESSQTKFHFENRIHGANPYDPIHDNAYILVQNIIIVCKTKDLYLRYIDV